MARILALLLAVLAPLAAAAQESPDALVKRVADDVLAIVKNDKDVQAGNPQKVVQLAEQKVLPHFDFARMTRLALGRNWQKANDAQREELVKQFRTLLVRTYSTSLHEYRDQKIEVKPTKMTPQDTDVVVHTVILQPAGGPPIPIDYSMEKNEGAWKVYDVVIDGASLVTTYRSSFNDQIQRGGVDGLIKTLEDRNRAPQPPKPPTAAAKAK